MPRADRVFLRDRLLEILRRCPPTSAATLGERVGRSSSSILSSLRELEERGLVGREYISARRILWKVMGG